MDSKKNLVKQAMQLYAVTDRAWTKEKTLYAQVEEALKGGVTCVQLREKERGFEDFLAQAVQMGELCRKYRVPFIVNDNVEIALRSKADGVHVGQSDMPLKRVRELLGPDKIIGVSAHTIREALTAERDGADYLGVGAMFSTGTKPDASPLSVNTLREICRAVTIPVVAIGGIKKSHISGLGGSGISGVALVSAIFAAENIEAECRELLSMVRGLFG
ncbi:MAG: thiamine phosphate synthase [Roseburia sp.]|nr:thiamine phosphate synthase [Roseburia sp.]